jgi:SNF2 family DNA or RNA helicase
MAGITRCVKGTASEVKFALTGTPLENSILELWSIFDYIMPGYLSNLTKFQTKYKIKDFDEESDKLIKGLSRVINPFILRRKKSDVVKELPEKLENDIYIDLDSEQKKLYAAELERVKKEMDDVINDGGINKARFMILQLLTKLRQLCIDPSIVYDEYTGTSNKIERLLAIVNEYTKNNHKVLIFSSFKTALNIVKEKLSDEDIPVFMIDGSVPAKKRQEMVTEFNESDDVKVFLIMLKSGGTGLNLASADVVIHLDLWWNPQAENQATDRAHRIGQKNTVEVIHLIMKGTIEEKILELQNKKRILSDKLIDGEARDKNILAELTKEDIENLLSYENKD